MLEYDVAIVGGGPVGSFVASKIAREKFNVTVFEKNKEIGLLLNCAGLITRRVFKFLSIPKNIVIQNMIKGAHIYSPSGKILTIGGNKVYGVAIDRIKFDKEIMKNAKNNGAEFFLGNNVLSVQKNKGFVEIKTSEKVDIRCKLVIGADGPRSTIRDRFVFPEPREFLRGIGAEVYNINIDPDFVNIFVGRDIAPGFFAWIIPTKHDGTSARIGLCIRQDAVHSPKHYFSNFLKNKQVSEYLKNMRITRCMGGIIPLGVLKKTYDSNVMLVGDAAAQVKPTSGGGIYPGLLCAKHCANVALEALRSDDFSASSLKKYQKLWSRDFGNELNMGIKFRSIFKKLTDKQMDKYIEKFQNPKIIETVNKYGDIDYPSKLVKPMLKKIPTLLKLAPSVIKE
jgi:geranylgeranyl reductase family protein